MRGTLRESIDFKSDIVYGQINGLDESQKKYVSEVVAERTAKKTKPAKIRFIPALYSFPLDFLRLWLREQKSRFNKDPIGAMSYRLNWKNLVKRQLWKHGSSKLFKYDYPVEGEKYVYFPMYFEDEWQNLVGPHFWSRNMYALIKELTVSLPSDYKLYVKEHPAVPAEVSFSKLKELQAMHNIRVIHPTVQGQALIDGCSALVVLVRTSG